MFRRDILKWWLRPGFLRPWGRRGSESRTLFAGPWLGEFGWELMSWQGFVRKLSRRYAKTVVYCPQGREALYADFATEIISHTFRGTAECDYVKEPDVMAQALEAARALLPRGADHLTPLGFQPFSRQEFFAYGKRSASGPDILFHARGRNFGTARNWEKAKWDELLARLEAAGLSLACIGVRGATLDPAGRFADFRDLPLDKTLDIIASARLVIGPSSGPMHLASLCRTPHLVWTDAKRGMRGHTNRTKYESMWNPFATPVRVLDAYGFDPPVDAVLSDIQTLLAAPVDAASAAAARPKPQAS